MRPSALLRLPGWMEMIRTGGTYVDPANSYGVELPMHQRPGHADG
jgi:hypothetical protein